MKSLCQNLIRVALVFLLPHVQCFIEPKIVGGFNVTSLDGFEHQVSLRYASNDRELFGSGHICGASLISPSLVLSAAHCVHDGEKYLRASVFTCVMGNINLFLRSIHTVERRVAEIVGHKYFDPDTFVNDIALLKLVSEVPYHNPMVKPIPIAKKEATAGQECQISGWGTTEYTEEDSVAVPNLKAVNITINSRTNCNRPNSHNGGVIRSMFCAGDFAGGKDSCQGDSGGPLSCDGVLVGITSHGFECARENFPGIYMDVGYYYGWIIANSSHRIYLNFFIILISCVTVFRLT